MKTSMRKMIALIMTFAMILSLTVNLTAFAADPNGSVTIQNATKGKVYDAYKIFDMTFDSKPDGSPTSTPAVNYIPPVTEDGEYYMDAAFASKVPLTGYDGPVYVKDARVTDKKLYVQDGVDDKGQPNYREAKGSDLTANPAKTFFVKDQYRDVRANYTYTSSDAAAKIQDDSTTPNVIEYAGNDAVLGYLLNGLPEIKDGTVVTNPEIASPFTLTDLGGGNFTVTEKPNVTGQQIGQFLNELLARDSKTDNPHFTVTKSVTADESTETISGLPYGYYLVKGTQTVSTPVAYDPEDASTYEYHYTDGTKVEDIAHPDSAKQIELSSECPNENDDPSDDHTTHTPDQCYKKFPVMQSKIVTDSVVTLDSTIPNALIIDKNQGPSWQWNPDYNPAGGPDGDNPDPNKFGQGKLVYNREDKLVKLNSADYDETVKFHIGVEAVAYAAPLHATDTAINASGEAEVVTYYYITDTLPKGFSPATNFSVIVTPTTPVTVKNADGTTTTTSDPIELFNQTEASAQDYKDGNYYTLFQTTNGDGESVFRIDVPFGEKYGSNALIVVEYEADVQHDAVIGFDKSPTAGENVPGNTCPNFGLTDDPAKTHAQGDSYDETHVHSADCYFNVTSGNINAADFSYVTDPSLDPKDDPENPNDPDNPPTPPVPGDKDYPKDPKDPTPIDPQNPPTTPPTTPPTVPTDPTYKPADLNNTETTTTVVYALGLNKIDSHGVKLDGAQFSLKDGTDEVWAIETGVDGVYEYVDAASVEEVKDGEGQVVSYRAWDQEKCTLGITDAHTAHTDACYSVATNVFSTDANGLLIIKGLAEGNYFFKEEVSPLGYNLLTDAIPVDAVLTDTSTYTKEITTYYDTDGSVLTDLTKVTETTESTTTNTPVAVVPLNVINYQGHELPSTGGIGTTIFYALGAFLIVGAGILLVTKKRMGANG